MVALHAQDVFEETRSILEPAGAAAVAGAKAYLQHYGLKGQQARRIGGTFVAWRAPGVWLMALRGGGSQGLPAHH